MKQHIKAAWAKIDPGHLMDGMFVPTGGKKRGRLYVPPRLFGSLEISFQGFEQLGADDQSVLLAISAQLGIDGLTISDEPKGEVGQQLRLALDFSQDDGAKIASRRTSLRALAIDAGYDPYGSTDKIKICLNRLRAAQVRETNRATGWDRACNLISVSFHKDGAAYIAANPRLSQAIFHGQHVRVSLFERNQLKSEVAKLLHCWLCSNVRLGQSLGNGNGARLDTLAPHIWGQGAWEGFSKQSKSYKRGLLVAALDEIFDATKYLHGGNGWEIDCTSSGLVMVSRPKNLPGWERRLALPSNQRRLLEEWFDGLIPKSL